MEAQHCTGWVRRITQNMHLSIAHFAIISSFRNITSLIDRVRTSYEVSYQADYLRRPYSAIVCDRPTIIRSQPCHLSCFRGLYFMSLRPIRSTHCVPSSYSLILSLVVFNDYISDVFAVRRVVSGLLADGDGIANRDCLPLISFLACISMQYLRLALLCFTRHLLLQSPPNASHLAQLPRDFV